MDVMLYKRCAKFIYIIPDGLRELMSDISREVIRSQPEHIYTFIADYLDALMITRENARVAARLVDSIIRIGETTVELLLVTGLSKEEADRMASIIQSAFKQYMADKKRPTLQIIVHGTDEEEEQDMVSNILDQYGKYIEQETEAAEIIQRAFRAFRERHHRENQMLSGMIDWRVAARSAIYLYRKTGVTYEEANRAATLIKAAYKGYYTRRVMKRLLEEGRLLYEEDEDRFQGDEMEMEEIPYDDTESRPTAHWKDYYTQLIDTDDGDEASPTTDYGVSSTDIADSIMDSVLKFIPTESEPGQASAGDWTDGFAADQTIIEGLELGLDTETMEYLENLQESPEMLEDISFDSATIATTQRSSRGFTLVEGAALAAGQMVDAEDGEEYLGSPEEIAGSPEDIVGGVEELPAISTVEETDYSETITDTEITSEVEPTREV